MIYLLAYLAFRVGLTFLMLWLGYRVFVRPKGSLTLIAAAGAVCTLIVPEMVAIICAVNWLIENGEKIIIWKRPEPAAALNKEEINR